MGNTIIRSFGNDHILEEYNSILQGINWKCRKWSSGKIECWGTINSIPISTWSRWGNQYYSNYITYGPSQDPFEIPAIFDNQPLLFAKGLLVSDAYAYDAWLAKRSWNFNSSNPVLPTFFFVRDGNLTIQTSARIDIYLTNMLN